MVLIMGTDMFLSFDRWKNPDVITAHAALGVLCRGDKGEKQAIEAKKAEMEAKGVRVYLVENQIITLFITFWQNYCKTGIGVCIFAVDNQP